MRKFLTATLLMATAACSYDAVVTEFDTDTVTVALGEDYIYSNAARQSEKEAYALQQATTLCGSRGYKPTLLNQTEYGTDNGIQTELKFACV